MGWEDEHFPKRHQRTQEELERPPRDPFPGHSLKLPAGSEYCGTGGHPKRPGPRPRRLPKSNASFTSQGPLYVDDPEKIPGRKQTKKFRVSICRISRQEETRKDVGPFFPALMASQSSGAISLYLQTCKAILSL